MLSILMASTGPSDLTGSPVNGDTSCVGVGDGVADAVGLGLGLGLGGAALPPGRATAAAVIAPPVTTMAAAAMILVLICHMAHAAVTGFGSRRSGRNHRNRCMCRRHPTTATSARTCSRW